MTERSPDFKYRVLMQDALVKLEKLQSQIKSLEESKTEPIAIIGLGCRFPRANSPEAFWQLLSKVVNAVAEIPTPRWDINRYYDQDANQPGKMYVREAGLLAEVDRFDADFFGLAPREVNHLDPQHRLLLEVSWEALERAAISPDRLQGSLTGVFMGLMNQDYSQLTSTPELVDMYTGSGNGNSFATGRISYLLGLQGPSITLDTSCSSSLVTVHLACQSLRNQECNLALAGGVNLILSPLTTIAECKARMLSPEHRCKTFDLEANGFVRGEGCGVIVLKRLSEAIADGDQIWAVIRGSAVNHDGRSSGLTVPNPLAQESVIRQALKNARVEPDQIGYVETHGTGTALGDPIEVGALGNVYAQNRSPDQPFWIGSVKTNIGHVEGAAGIAGLIKVVLGLQYQQIPPNLHFERPNPQIDWQQPIQVPTSLQPWPAIAGCRMAGVSSFGASGTNAHLIVAEAAPSEFPVPEPERSLHLLTVSAKTEAALRELAQGYLDYLNENPTVTVGEFCTTLTVGRSHFDHRLSGVVGSCQEVRRLLGDFLTSERSEVGVVSRSQTPKVAMLFAGQGSQWFGMGQQLYQTQPKFRQAIDRCADILSPELEMSLQDILYGDENLLQQTVYTQPALFAVEYALYQLWKSWGIQPDGVLGHSVGEYVAATVAGVFSLEEGLKLIARRGRLMQRCSRGKMVAVWAGVERVSSLIASYSTVVISAENGPENVVISGEESDLNSIVACLSDLGVKTKFLNVSGAFHSPLIEPILSDFAEVAAQIRYTLPEIDFVSNLTGSWIDREISRPQYWVDQMRNPVRWTEGINQFLLAGYQIFLEVSPQPTLTTLGKLGWGTTEKLWLPSLNPQKSDWQQLLESLATLYSRGVAIDWRGFEEDYPRRRLSLLTYPWQRQRYWLDSAFPTASDGLLSSSAMTLLDLLKQGNRAEVLRVLKQTEDWSPSEQELLPKLLSALEKTYQPTSVSSSIQDWFYQVEWQPQVRFRGQSQPDLSMALLPSVDGIYQKFIEQKDDWIEFIDQLEVYQSEIEELEKISIVYIIQGLKKLGWKDGVNLAFSTDEMASNLGLIERYYRWLNRCLEILKDWGFLEKDRSNWKVKTGLDSFEENLDNRRISNIQSANIELMLLQQCGENLAEVLTGKVDPLQLLFHRGDLTTASRLYQESPVAIAQNKIAQKAIDLALEKLSASQGVKILEIGAGTGGTTAAVLPHLNPQKTEYIFTDVGAVFLTEAAQKFNDYTFVQYKVLDIEVNPEEQGFVNEKYDLIIAANVLHATASLTQSLTYVKQLLAPGGILILLEATSLQNWIDLTFGLTEGWWKFNDEERENYPLLSEEKWQKLLSKVGFNSVEVLSLEKLEPTKVLSSQAVFLAQKSLTPSLSDVQKHWLIFGDRQGFSHELARRFQEKGHQYTLVFPADCYAQISPTEFQINPNESENFSRLLAEIKGLNSPWQGMINCWSLDTPNSSSLTEIDLEPSSLLVCGSTLHLVQALIEAKIPKYIGLWNVTKGAQSVSEEAVPGVIQSPLWGFGKVIALEHPELNCVRIDLDVNTALMDQVNELFTEIIFRSHEDQIAFRNGIRYVERLVESSPQIVNHFSGFKPNSTYLITGGLGGLGLLLAEWMVSQGAKYLVLVGRHPVREEAKKQLEKLEEMGASVTVIQADISQRQEVNQVFKRIQSSLPALRGIIHSAGILDDGVIQQLSWERFYQVMAAKVEGAWHLHSLTKDLSLDYFILFSSVAAVLGNLGQANHSAANAFLDALVYERCSQGLPAASINWGPVADVGTVAKKNISVQLKEIGIETLIPEDVLQVFNQLFSGHSICFAVMAIRWSKLKKEWLNLPLLTNVKHYSGLQDSQPVKAEYIKFGSDLKQIKEALTAQVCLQITQVLSLKSVESLDKDKGFFDMGMDSLTSVDLKNRLQSELGFSLPSTLLFDYPNVNQLIDYLLQTFYLTPNSDRLEKPDCQEEYIDEELELFLNEMEQISDDEIKTHIPQIFDRIF